MVKTLLDDLSQICSNMKFEVILTINVPETMIESQLDYSFPIKVIHNQYPKGFGSNHNSAFEKAQGNYFCVLQHLKTQEGMKALQLSSYYNSRHNFLK